MLSLHFFGFSFLGSRIPLAQGRKLCAVDTGSCNSGLFGELLLVRVRPHKEVFGQTMFGSGFVGDIKFLKTKLSFV